MSVAYLIAGAGGMLGTALQRVLGERGLRFIAPDELDFDITDEGAVRAQVAGFAEGLAAGDRGVLINAAAYTNVERAEEEPDTAYRVNEDGAALLASAARTAGLRFVHVSTDFVFDGHKCEAYVEDDAPNPLSVYGASKLAGEAAVAAAYPDAVIGRTAWVFGAGGINFPMKILAAARDGRALKVVTDEIGSPTYTVDLAIALIDLEATGESGVYHLAGAGSCTRHELAVEVLRIAGIDADIAPVLSSDFVTKAERPRNSVLDCSKAASLGVILPPWRQAIARYLQEL